MPLSEISEGTPSLRCLLALMQIWIASFPAMTLGFCAENQTVELGKEGIVSCGFPDDFHTVYWYDDLNPETAPVIIFTPKSAHESKTGHGFENKTYNVLQNGSLQILRVTAWHQRRYKVLLESIPSRYDPFIIIAVKVIAYPGETFPTIECDDCQKNYYNLAVGYGMITCSFTISRPPVWIELIERSRNGDSLVEEQIYNKTENKDGTFNSSATVRLKRGGNKLISLLVCRATWDPGTWRREKQMLLDFSHAESFSSVSSSVLYIEVSKRAEVQCGGSDQTSKIWKRIPSQGEPQIIGFSTGILTQVITKIANVEVSKEGSLVFSSPQLYHEGVYLCLYGDGKQNEIRMTTVTALVPPSPPYLQIIGCENRVRPCEFNDENINQVTCAVYGAHPKVSLEWSAKNPNRISFSNFHEVVTERSKTFDVSVSANFKVSEDILCEEDILIECHIDGPLAKVIKAEASAVIIPKFCKTKTVPGSMNSLIIIVILLIICIFVSHISFFLMLRYIWRKLNDGNNGPRNIKENYREMQDDAVRSVEEEL